MKLFSIISDWIHVWIVPVILERLHLPEVGNLTYFYQILSCIFLRSFTSNVISNQKQNKTYLRWVDYTYLSQYNFHAALLNSEMLMLLHHSLQIKWIKKYESLHVHLTLLCVKKIKFKDFSYLLSSKFQRSGDFCWNPQI